MLAVPREPRVLQSESGVGQRDVKLSYGLTQSWGVHHGASQFRQTGDERVDGVARGLHIVGIVDDDGEGQRSPAGA